MPDKMQQRSVANHVPYRPTQSNVVMNTNRSRTCNGDVKLVEFKLQRFPWDVFVLLWSLAALLAVIAPYLAKSIPPTYRTDIKWWMSGIVYQLPAPSTDQRHYFNDFISQVDDLHALGITAVRMSNFFKTAPDGAVIDYLSPNPSYGSVVEFENVMDVLVKKEMRLIIDIPTTHTSTAHTWFDEDKEHRSRDSVYAWKQTPHEGDNEQEIETYWTRDSIRQEYYQHTKDCPKSAFINHVTQTARTKIQAVLGYWLQQGVSGFVLLDYDKLIFREQDTGSDHNHIQFEHPKVVQLRRLLNLTKTYKNYLTEQQRTIDLDEPVDILMAVDISWQDDATWHALYDAGADIVINHEFVMSKDYKISGDINPFDLRQQVCDDNSFIESPDRDNTQNIVNMLQLLLPGTAFVCHGQLPYKQNYNHMDTAEHFRQMAKWRLTSAMSWGETQLSYVDRNTFSFVRYAFGKMYPRYIIIANIGSHPHRHNFSMVRDGLVVPDLGILRYFTCPDNSDVTVPTSDRHVINSLIYLNNTVVHPRCGLLVELKLKPSI